MKICYFGTYEKNYPLNSIITKGLRKNGAEVIECHVSLWEKYKDKHGSFLKLFSLIKLIIGLIISYLKLGFKFLKQCRNVDIIIVGYIGQLDIFYLRFLILFLRNKPEVVFIPLVSLYDTAIIDRGLSSKRNIFAKVLFYIDKFSFMLSDLIILDTNEHIEYICDLFNLDKNKFERVWVGADEDIFYPIENDKKNKEFTVLFFGKYIPLHGLEFIIKAAKLLDDEKNIKIKMIGNGQLYDKMFQLSKEIGVKNIEFIEWIEYEKLIEETAKADVILGIFGGTEKSLRVIPNKIFQAVACKKPVITGESAAIKELFTNKKNILLCKNRDAESLKDAILFLKNDEKFRNEIANDGYEIFQKKLDSYHIGKSVLNFINNF